MNEIFYERLNSFYKRLVSMKMDAEEQYDYALKVLDENPDDEVYQQRTRDLKLEIMTYDRVIKEYGIVFIDTDVNKYI